MNYLVALLRGGVFVFYIQEVLVNWIFESGLSVHKGIYFFFAVEKREFG